MPYPLEVKINARTPIMRRTCIPDPRTRRRPRGRPALDLPLMLVLLLGCAHAPDRMTSTPPASSHDRARPAATITTTNTTASARPTPAAPPSTTAQAASDDTMLVTSSSLTPALGALTRALASRKGEVRLQELFARDIPDFATGDGKGLPDKATVDVVEIRNKDLVMAFLRFSPPGHRRCDDTGPDAETRVLYVGRAKDGVERIRLTEEFSAADTQIFDGKRVNVVFPPIAPAVVEVHYDYESPCESLDSSGQRVELFHLASRERIGDPISVYATRAVPGMSTVEQAKLAWFKSTELGAAFLAITRFNTETVTPCTGETVDRSAACRPQFGCVRTTKLLVVSAESVTNAEGVDELKRAHPALSKLPPDLTANSKAGCQKLEPR